MVGNQSLEVVQGYTRSRSSLLCALDQRRTLETTAQDAAKLSANWMQVAVPYPKRTRTIRVVVEDQNGGRIGTAELDRRMTDAVPEGSTPEPLLAPTAPIHGAPQNHE